jgi:DNA-directed RNA polymerase subunit E'/Rpb7
MSSAKMFMPIKFNTTIQLQPKEVNSKFEETILKKLKQNLENVCSRHGYIKKDSIKIIKRSAGYFKEQHFNGNLAFDLNCIAEICNPAQDSIITCRVKGKNALGIRAEGSYDNYTILEIVIPKLSYGIQ